jgi:hypothetical protein
MRECQSSGSGITSSAPAVGGSGADTDLPGGRLQTGQTWWTAVACGVRCVVCPECDSDVTGEGEGQL